MLSFCYIEVRISYEKEVSNKLFEFINGLFLDVSLIYVSLIVLVMFFAITYIGQLSIKQLMNEPYVIHDSDRLIKVNREQVTRPLTMNESLLIWLSITFERTDEQDDESDSLSPSIIKYKNIRGGLLCRHNSYSSSVVSL